MNILKIILGNNYAIKIRNKKFYQKAYRDNFDEEIIRKEIGKTGVRITNLFERVFGLFKLK